MSRTLTNQAHLFPASGTEQTWTASTAVHSVIPYDLPSMLDNLKGYVDLCAGYCQAPAGVINKDVFTDAGDPPSQVTTFIAQAPTLVPHGARRMLWTCGVKVDAGGGARTILASLSVFLSPTPYVGDGTGDFATILPPGYGSRTVAVSLNVTGATSGYTFSADTSTGLVSPPGWDQGHDRLAFLILAADVGSNEVEADNLRIYDFTWWFLYE